MSRLSDVIDSLQKHDQNQFIKMSFLTFKSLKKHFIISDTLDL